MDTQTRESPIREKPLPLPGQYLDEKLSDLAMNEGFNYVLTVALALTLAVGALAQYFAQGYPLYWFFFLVAAVSAAWAAFGFIRLIGLAKRLKLGRQGERHVGQLLQTLDVPGARVFHDIPTDRGNLDHVIVCDRGIFVVETKTWRKANGEQIEVRDGRLYRRGRPLPGDAVGQAAAGARWLNRVLERAEIGKPYECKPVVVLPGWFVRMDDATKKQGWVLEPKALLQWIPKEPVKLHSDDVRRIADAIANYIRSRMNIARA